MKNYLHSAPLLLAALAGVAQAQDIDPKKQQERIEALEKIVQELQKQVGKPKEGQAKSDDDYLKDPAANPQSAPASKVGDLQPNYQGFKLAQGKHGDMNFGLFTYVRYLNQNATEETYTDSFGRTLTVDQRNDIQLQKMRFSVKGWAIDPNFRYNVWVWTSNSAQGNGAQVVGAGSLGYRFADWLILEGGIWSLPAVRTLEGEFPRLLKTDSRTIADEFFRPSYTSGIWAMGALAEGVSYRAMVANNLSALGVDAVQLDNKVDTASLSLVWKPGNEYGMGLGDFEHHESPATRFGIHATSSTEDRQSQPGKNDPENTQIRLSDGTAIFDIDAFAPGTQIENAHYTMASIDAGLKYRGFSLEGEYYLRYLYDFEGTGPIPVQRVFDQGFQLQASYMVIPQHLQVYSSGSKVFGDYGDPWDLSLGVNWFPFSEPGYGRQFRVNPEVVYLRNCPTGNPSVPYSVGSDGFIFLISSELNF